MFHLVLYWVMGDRSWVMGKRVKSIVRGAESKDRRWEMGVIGFTKLF